MQILASAKINLCLDILIRTPSGYHEIQTVFHELKTLQDELEINESQEDDNVSTAQTSKATYPSLPQEENLAFKALKLLKNTYKIQKSAQITIKKNIPIAAGLGGASSDAAATLKGLNELWNLNLSTKELFDLASQLGADVAFFILGGTALGEHFGEKLTPLPSIKNMEFTIASPEKWVKLSVDANQKTKQMYESLDLSRCGKNKQKTTNLISAIKNQNPQKILQNLHNDFETITPVQKGHHLSGSGPATFTTTEIL